jgi:hypothetical protein
VPHKQTNKQTNKQTSLAFFDQVIASVGKNRTQYWFLRKTPNCLRRKLTQMAENSDHM